MSTFTDITDRKKAERALKDALEVISDSIQYASHIQHSILPLPYNLKAAMPEYFIIWEPRDLVGGDLYWCRPWGDGHLIMLGDCTGHGVPGAFMTLITNGTLGQAYREVECGYPDKLIGRMHQLIQASLGQYREEGKSDDGLEIGVCYIPEKRDKLLFSGARFSLFYKDGESPVVELKGDKKGIGYRGIPEDTLFTTHEVGVPVGRRFYMATDGILDQVGVVSGKRRGFGKKRFKALLDQLADQPLETHGEKLLAALIAHQGTEDRRDDVSLLGFCINPD